MQLVDGSEACMCVCVFVLEQWLTSLRSSHSFPQLLGFRSQASRQSQRRRIWNVPTHFMLLQAEFSNVGTTVLSLPFDRASTHKGAACSHAGLLFTQVHVVQQNGNACLLDVLNMRKSLQIIVIVHAVQSAQVKNAITPLLQAALITTRNPLAVVWMWRDIANFLQRNERVKPLRSVWRSSAVLIICRAPAQTLRILPCLFCRPASSLAAHTLLTLSLHLHRWPISSIGSDTIPHRTSEQCRGSSSHSNNCTSIIV